LFEVGFGASYAAVGVIFHAPVFVLASFVILGNLIIALNPLGRFDSYWMLSDALGIADLSKQRSRLLRLAFGRGHLSSGPPRSYVGFRRAVIIGYSMLTVLVVGWYCYTATRLAAPFVDHLELTAAAVGRNFGSDRPLSGLRNLVSIGPGVLMFGVMLYRLGRVLASLFRKLTHSRTN
jgi:putative peptide zinc metalloprotease protein